MNNVVCFKWIFYVSQLLLLCFGTGFIVVGTLFLTIFKHDYHFITFSVQVAAIVIITFGGAFALSVLFGFISTKIENNNVKFVPIFLVLLTLLASLVFGIWGFIDIASSKFKTTATNELIETFDKYNETDTKNLNTLEVNWLQRKFECCGLFSINDWEKHKITPLETPLSDIHIDELQAKNRSTFDLPDSCCIQKTDNCGKEFPNRVNIFSDSCFDKFYTFLIQDLKVIFGISCALASISLVPVILMFYAMHKFSGDYTKINSN